MSNYTKSTNFATKDGLSSGSALKRVKGAELDHEFNALATAVATKANDADKMGVVLDGVTTTARKIYINTNAASGGSNGDIWLEY